ncbi:sensor histidine kinase [Desulforamulus hydrothermalis]|uniref:histidine kinase n=1 Tax=Desulforamulus hydrothermalis Lam5 = DSM 18033 TaxID=1121428 RepID=K8E801_9FIRM|nr:ATP-binding protein [Desulforamulus hydrothermalis]CCO07633.1 putative Histidine kinase [Desulforamulus hydrothermalis Lam5 = DSM 18033]SHH19464.1 two-component system, CitB family, cit operon sensor histidine kinase CitA [Desulforamulus hydrothermalis Lam5 = DSM 18033]
MPHYSQSKSRQTLTNLIVAVNILTCVCIVIAAWLLRMDDLTRNSLLAAGLLMPKLPQAENLLLLLSSVLVLTSIYFFCRYNRLATLEQEYIKEKMLCETARNTIQLLRCHRHDFLNHMQVVLGYLQLGKPDAAQTYLLNLNQELQAIREINQPDLPGIVVLLYSKQQEAQRHNIRLTFELRGSLNHLQVREIDLTRIMANLVDNAIYELARNPSAASRLINIILEYINNRLYLTVANTGSFIPDTAAIFKYGFTTKGERGSGIGLYNVKKIVEKYNGQIYVESDETEGTSFTIVI